MTDFTFATAGRILFGPGRAGELPALVAALGDRPLVCVGSSPSRHRALLDALGGGVEVFRVAGEPDLDTVRRGAAAARAHGADVIVGLGGGAVLDAAKIVAALAVNPGDILDYVEVIGAGRALERPPLPLVAVPTTAGTGSEVTANGVVSSPEHGVKVSLRATSMIPDVALVDPELTLGCPPAVTASAGLDAFTQCLEPFVSPFATPFTDALCIEGLHRLGLGLRAAYEDGSDLEARTEVALGALCSGMALANAKLGAVHGLAGVIGGLTGAPHGATCAALLAATCRTNIAALRRADPEHPALARYAEAGQVLTGEADEDALLGWIADTVAALGIGGLATLGLDPEDHPRVCRQAAASSSMKGNPVALTEEELLGILAASA